MDKGEGSGAEKVELCQKRSRKSSVGNQLGRSQRAASSLHVPFCVQLLERTCWKQVLKRECLLIFKL